MSGQWSYFDCFSLPFYPINQSPGPKIISQDSGALSSVIYLLIEANRTSNNGKHLRIWLEPNNFHFMIPRFYSMISNILSCCNPSNSRISQIQQNMADSSTLPDPFRDGVEGFEGFSSCEKDRRRSSPEPYFGGVFL